MSTRADDRRLRELTYLKGLGRRIRLRRLTLEMSQENLAEASAISRNFVSSIERGAHGVDLIRIFRIAEALKMPIEKLVGEPKPPEETV